MSKLITVLVLLLSSIGVFFAFRTNTSRNSDPQMTNSSAESSPKAVESSEQSAGELFTKEQVADHKSKDDCWTIVDNMVYDITAYVPRHPGGDEILRACGNDGTTLFTQRKSNDGEKVGSGTPHSERAESQLSSLQIGQLSE